MASLTECLRVFVQCQSAGNRSGGMVRLLSRSAKKDVQGIPNDLCDRAVVGKNDIRHAGEILIEQWSEHAWFQRFHEGGETGDVREERCNFAALPTKIDSVSITGQPLRQVRREVAR